MSQTGNIFTAFLHGLTGVGLFRRLGYPGAPTEFFDSRPFEEFLSDGDLLPFLDEVDEAGHWTLSRAVVREEWLEAHMKSDAGREESKITARTAH